MLYPNLDFEYELAALVEGRAYAPHRGVVRLIERWKDILRLMGPADFVAWGMSPSSYEQMIAAGHEPPPFSAELVASINDKRFSHALELALGIALPGARVVSSINELRESAESSPHPWVAKHPFGVSGRERVKGEAGALSEDQGRWAENQFSRAWELVFEPWIDVDCEYSLQFEIDPDEGPRFLGALELVTDSQGTHRGHRNLSDKLALDPLLTSALEGVENIASLGYTGPVGVDAFTGHLDSLPIVRPITEINARHTFGRLALELSRFIPEGLSFYWWHPSARRLKEHCEPVIGPIDEGFKGSGDYYLPTFADPGGRSGTVLRL